MLSILLLVPLLGVLCIYLFPKRASRVALGTTLLMAAFGAFGLTRFAYNLSGFQFEESYHIVELLGIEVTAHLGVDGISSPLILLTILLGIVSVLVSQREIARDQPTFYSLLLVLLTCVMGVFMSVDLVLFFVFWEAVLVIMFLLVLYWGGERRKYAAMKFLVYTGIGSAGLLLAIILLAVYAGSVNLASLPFVTLDRGIQHVIFISLLFAFFVKMPIVPFHTWLPDAHVEAPTAGSIMLAGVLLKMGSYGLLRIGLGVLHDASLVFRTFLFVMGTGTILYGAFVCLQQHNLKRLIAYSSVNHMGFVLLGLAAGSTLGIIGAVFEMVSHGLIAALLFALAGLVHQRTGTFDLASLRGLASVMPRTAWFITIAALGGMGLPSMTGFIAEFLVLYATYATFGLLGLIPLLGVLLTGAYTVRMLAKVVFGTSTLKVQEDASMLPFGILAIVIFILGLLPFLLIGMVVVQ